MTLDMKDDAALSIPTSAHRRSWRRPLRWAVNSWLAFHLAAIVIAPASVTPSSDLVRSAWLVVRPYLQVLYLNHGYHFFAPEPDASTLLAYVAERPDGMVIRGRIPNRSITPRLLYHRHFMLSEHMAVAPPELHDAWLRSITAHLRREYGAARVRLALQRHLLPTSDLVRGGARLDDPASYAEQPLGVFQ